MAEDIRAFLQSFNGVKQTGSHQYICKCPAHEDKKASLSIKDDTDKTGKILLSCHAGCRTEDILARVGKSFADVQPSRAEAKDKPLQSWQRNLVAEYKYTDENGKYLYSKLRYEGEGIDGKDIKYGRTENGFKSGRGDCKPTLYNLPELQKAIKHKKTVYYVEGEKDVETMRQCGLCAVTSGGVKDWRPEYVKFFVGATDVVIIADQDDAGRELAERVSRDLTQVSYKNRIVAPSGINHGDITDYFEKEGGSRDRLFTIVDAAETVPAKWVGEKGKINPGLLAVAILNLYDIKIATNPGTKSDQILLYRDGVYNFISDNELKRLIEKWCPDWIVSNSIIDNTAKVVIYKADVVEYSELNSDESCINLQNGLLDIHTGELKEHTPRLLSTLQLNCRFEPYAKAPQWRTFVDSLCYDPETEKVDTDMRAKLQEWTGFILSQIFGYRLKAAMINYAAEGNTGRSVYQNVLAGMMGEEATVNVPFEDIASSRWATGRIFGTRAVIVGDEGGNRIDKSSTFKQLTGGDKVGAELKGLQGFDFRYKGVIVAACNQLPYFDDDKGNHVAERLSFIHCRNTVPENERDPALLDKLLKERDGIFQWAWEGLQRFLKNGMRFTQCASSQTLMKEYRARHDTMYSFLGEKVDVTGNKSDYIKKTELQNMYVAYCQAEGKTALSNENIKQRLASLGVPMKLRDGYDAYIGIKPKIFSEVDSAEYPPF